MTSQIIAAQFTPPPSAYRFAERARVSSELTRSLGGIGCIVHASAGYGKTTALAHWYKQQIANGYTSAWLTLDEKHRNIMLFLEHFIATVKAAGFPQFEESSSELASLTDSDALALAVLQRLTQAAEKHVLVLDNVHAAASPETQKFLHRVLHASIPGLSLIIGTREIPPLIPFADLRVTGELSVVGQNDLALTADEIAQLMATECSLCVGDSTLWNRIRDRTEGWPVAVALIIHAVKRGENLQDAIENLSGVGGALSDYFWEQSLVSLEPDAQRFLVANSIVETMTGDLGASLCPSVDGWAMLDKLERGNAFLVRTDSEGHCYRHHQLYREFLAERQLRSQDFDQSALHQAASTWFRSNGQLHAAVHHAMAAKDVKTSAELLESLGGWQYALRGNIDLVQSVLKEMTSSSLADFPRLWMARVYLSARLGHYRSSIEDLKRVSAKVHTSYSGDESLASDLVLIETLVQRYTDSPVSEEKLKKIENLDAKIPADNDVLQAVRANFLCAMYRELERYEDSDRLGQLAIERYREFGSHYAETFIYFHQGLAMMRQARFRSAEHYYSQGLELASKLSPADNDLVAIGRILLAECLYEMGQTQESIPMLERGLRHAESADAWLEVYFSAYSTLLRHAFVQGDRALRERTYKRATVTAERRNLPRLARLTSLLHHDLTARGGTIEKALEETSVRERVWDAPSRDLLTTLQARGLIADGKLAEARNLLLEPTICSRSRGSYRIFLGHTLLQAGIEWRDGNTSLAIEKFDAAVSIALVEGACQIFIEEAVLISPLVAALVKTPSVKGMAPARLSFLRRLHAEIQTYSAPVTGRQSPLSARELEILRCLMLGESNREIADAKCLSVNTVKFHLKNIYGKLGASSRDEAVAYAIRDQLI